VRHPLFPHGKRLCHTYEAPLIACPMFQCPIMMPSWVNSRFPVGLTEVTESSDIHPTQDRLSWAGILFSHNVLCGQRGLNPLIFS